MIKKEQFKSTYLNFFSENDLIISGNNILDWGYGPIKSSLDTMIRQKIGIKSYIGVTINKSSSFILFRKSLNYDHKENAFVENAYIEVNKHEDKITQRVFEFLQKHNYHYGIEINFLSETTKGHGFGTLGVNLTLLSVLLYILIEKLAIDDLQNLESHPYFEEIYDLSTELIALSTDGHALGANNYTVLTQSNYPILFSKKDDRIAREMIHGKTNELDFGILYFGLNESFEDLLTTMKHNEQIFSEDSLSISINTLHKFLKHELFYHLKHIYENFNGDIDTLKKNLIICASKNLGFNAIIEKENGLYTHIKYFFDKYRTFGDETIGIIPLNTGKDGGSLIYILSNKNAQFTFSKIIRELSKKYSIFHEYASYENMEYLGPPRVEQYISKGIIGKYIDKSKVLYYDTVGTRKLGFYNDLVAENRTGILLNTIEGKIYVNGVKLTSKNIKSQSFTIELLDNLIQNIGQDIPNNKLPLSSYSTDRNQITGKIIIPFTRLANEIFGENIKIKCHGENGKFSVIMEETQIKIGVIKKI